MNCICCNHKQKMLNNEPDNPSNNPDGATWIQIDPGYGSKLDNMCNYPFYGVICDKCLMSISRNLKRFELISDVRYKEC